MIFSIANEDADATTSRRGALDGRNPANESFNLPILYDFASKPLLFKFIVRLFENFIGLRGLPLSTSLVKLGRSPLGEEVIGDVVMSIDKARKDVCISYGKNRGAGRVVAIDRNARDGFAFDHDFAIQNLVRCNDLPFEYLF